jgi:MFS family permease
MHRFSLLKFSPPNNVFFVLCLCVRVFESIGGKRRVLKSATTLPCLASAFSTASFAICAHVYHGRVATIIGVLETFSGLGFAAGPVLGGILYEVGIQ